MSAGDDGGGSILSSFLLQLSHPVEICEQGPEADERLLGGKPCWPGFSAMCLWSRVDGGSRFSFSWCGGADQRQRRGWGSLQEGRDRTAHTAGQSPAQECSAAVPPPLFPFHGFSCLTSLIFTFVLFLKRTFYRLDLEPLSWSFRRYPREGCLLLQ